MSQTLSQAVQPQHRHSMRIEIADVLSKTGKYQDADNIRKSTLEFEEKVFRQSSNYAEYIRAIQSKLNKIRSTFIVEKNDNSGNNGMVKEDLDKKKVADKCQWFDKNSRVLKALLIKRNPLINWKSELSPILRKYLITPPSLELATQSQLDELNMIRDEYLRICMEAQKLKKKKVASIAVPEALDELVNFVTGAVDSIQSVISDSNNTESKVEDCDGFCHRLNINRLRANLSHLSDYLSPFLVMKKKDKLDSAFQNSCVVCGQAQASEASLVNDRYGSLKIHFNWQSLSSSTSSSSVNTSMKVVDASSISREASALFSLILPRLELLENFVKSFSEENTSSCLTVQFMRQQAVHFRLLSEWFRSLIKILQEVVIPFVNVAQKNTKVSGEEVTKSATSSKYRFETKRSQNLACVQSCPPKRLKTLTSLDSLTYSASNVSYCTKSNECFHSIASVLFALEQKHDIKFTYPCGHISRNRGVQSPFIQFRVKRVSQSQNSIEDYDGATFVIDIACDSKFLPLYVTISHSAGSEFDLPDMSTYTPRFQQDSSTCSHLLYRRMNEFIASERLRYGDLDTEGQGGTSTSQFDVLYKILSDFVVHFDLSSDMNNVNGLGAAKHEGTGTSLFVSPVTGEMKLMVHLTGQK